MGVFVLLLLAHFLLICAGITGLALFVELLGRELLSRLIFPLLLSLWLLFVRARGGSLTGVLVLLL